MESFNLFLIVAPGLEDLAAKEIGLKLPVKDLQIIKGGIELSAPLEWIENAHLLLKIPTRILLRIKTFKVRDFPKLYQKFSDFRWNDYLSHPEPEFEITCHQSRLNHTGRIEETIRKALTEALLKQPLRKDWEKKNYPPQTFYVRLNLDELTLSLDLTGEPLYKRGLQKIKGEAPLRESLAAALLLEIFEGVEDEVTLVDPMCGSGTFLTEALTFYSPLHLRPFAFETAPFYRGKILKVPEPRKGFPLKKVLGLDLNGDLLKKVREETSLPLELREGNSLTEKIVAEVPVIMVCNPPYGERIRIEDRRGSFLRSAWEKFLTVDRPYRFTWILPSDMDDLFLRPDGYRVVSKRHLKNGGLAVTFWIWEKTQGR